MTVGACLVVEGEWKVDKRYGRQFAAQSWEEELPATIVGIEKYLGSGLVKGIGPKFAKLIVSHFGLATFDVIETIAVLNQDTKQVPFWGRFSYSSISNQEVGQRTSPSDMRKFSRFSI